jgi:hypothetical protein
MEIEMDFTIGCDPELFVKEIEGNYVSAHDLIPGTKEEPYRVESGYIQVDGTALEFNIDPASSYLDFVGNINDVLFNLHDRIEGGPFSDLFISYDPSATFDPDYFDHLPDHAKLLGCMPDFNAYTGEENTPPTTTEPFRTAGGHIHLGWGDYFDVNDPEHFRLCRDVTKQMDAMLFNASKVWDKDNKRRNLYGERGAFRPKMYGVEYRPLSCRWVENDETIRFVYEQSMMALDLFFNKGVKLYEN